MNEPRDLKSVKAFLLRHGHTKEEIERLDKESVINLYEKDTRKNTLNFLHYMNEDTFSVISTLDEADIGEFKLKVQENLDNMAILVDIIRDGFNDFSYADIADTLTLNIKNISIHKLQRILRIAYREFQEILLDKIATQLKELPIEEYKTIMNHYESIRGDTARLRSTIQELSY